MRCRCGEVLERKTREENPGQTVYDKCKGCGIVQIISSTSGSAWKMAYHANKKHLDVLRNTVVELKYMTQDIPPTPSGEEV